MRRSRILVAGKLSALVHVNAIDAVGNDVEQELLVAGGPQ